jgi:hypothetical protein
MRVVVGGFGVLVTMLAMFLSCRSVMFRLVVLAHIVMMCRLKVMVGCCVMMSSRSVMMLAGRVFLFRHVVTSPQ